MSLALRVSFVLTLCTTALCAQRIVWSPAGSNTMAGNGGNTIPFRAMSATYQQIHGDTDMVAVVGTAPVALSALALRLQTNGATTLARTLDLQLVLDTTAVAPANINTVFARNLSATPTTVLPYTNVNIPALINMGSPNPPGIVIPFTTPYLFLPGSGRHLVWEWRHRNASSTGIVGIDAASGIDSFFLPFLGAGCTATGQAQPAIIDQRSLIILNGNYRNRLARAVPNAIALFFFDLRANNIPIPGLCAPLELLPVFNVAGTTDAAGQWDLSLTFGPMTGFPSVSIYGQFAFADAGLPLGFGLSNASVFRLPPPSYTQVARAYVAPSGGTNGNELATMGSLTTNYGLVTGVQVP